MAWFEDDSFWARLGPILFDERRLGATASEVDGLVALGGIGSGDRVLDLACGPGRHALELARRGVNVTAVDLSTTYTEALRGEVGDLPVEVVTADMRSFRRPGAFDVASLLFTSLGYFDDPDEDRVTLANARDSLVPGGRLVVDVIGKEIVDRGFQERYWTWLPDGRLLLEEREIGPGWRSATTTWTMLGPGAPESLALRHRLYSGTELEHLLLAAGFTTVALYGGLDGIPYDRRAWRLVAVATT